MPSLQAELDGKFKLPHDIRTFFNEDRPLERLDQQLVETFVGQKIGLSNENLSKAIDIIFENINNAIVNNPITNARETRWKLHILCTIVDCANGLQSEQKLLEYSSQEENRFYYDLIELSNGSHIPVTMIKPFCRDFFLKRKEIKTRDHNFFYCPSCGENSFYSFHSSGCDSCGFNSTFFHYDFSTRKSDFEKKANKRYAKKQRKKRFLLKSGLWVFKVKAYVKADRTKNKVDRDKVESFISTGEYE